jgi:cysteine desulfurase
VRCYLDHNATSPLLPAAREALVSALGAANPSSPHAEGRAAAATLEAARREVAALAGVPPRDVIFTSGATEANAQVLAAAQGEAWASAVEHPSVRAWANRLLPVDRHGRLDLDALEGALSAAARPPAVVSLMAANHETGVLQPVSDAAALCARFGVPLHCDATQALGRVALPTGPRWWTVSAHKLGGPRGIGALIGAPPHPALLRGGPQERGARPGTVAVPLAAGFGAAAAAARARGPWPSGQTAALEEALVALGAQILGVGVPRLPNTTCALAALPGELLVMALDLAGVAVSTGAACASGAAEPSATLRAMGLDGVPVRFSLGYDTDPGPAIAVLPAVWAQVARAFHGTDGASGPHGAGAAGGGAGRCA